MDKETEEAFDRLFSNIDKLKKESDFVPSYKKNSLEISVYELADLAGLKFFNGHYEELGLVTKRKSQLINEYFKSPKLSLEEKTNELYDLFPDFLQGEPRWKIDPSLLGSHVPTYDKIEVEK